MSIYRFTPGSAVEGITFRYANDRDPIALIEAGRSDAGALNSVRRALEMRKWPCVPAEAGGRHVLQVQGFKEEGQLSAFLQAAHFAEGSPSITPEPGDHPSRSWKEWLEDSSIKAGGWSYLVGDGTLLLSGMMSGRTKEVTSGALYTAGGLVLARYGNVKNEYHLRKVAHGLGKHLKQQAVDLPENCSLFSVCKDMKEGTIKNVEDFLTRYPPQVTLGIYTLGAFAMLQSGIKERKFWDAAYGANSTATKLASILIPEKKKDESGQKREKPSGPLARVVDWVQEKPLRVFGYGSMLSAGMLGLSAYREYQHDPRQKSYIFKSITAGTYLIGDLLMAMSSKDHVNADGKFDAEEQRRIEALAAEVIAHQPKELQPGLAHQAAGFLSTQGEMKGTAAEISRSILHQAEEMRKNPWAVAASAQWQSRASRPAAPTPLQPG